MRSPFYLAALLAVPAIAAAQSVRGLIVERADSVPVPGAVVLLLDRSGGVAARALTNERGEYRLAAPGPGTYRVRTLRIGFRPETSPPIGLAAGQETVHAAMVAGAPVMLDTVRVLGRNVCRLHGDSAVATYGLWEQARTALTAVDLTARARALNATIVTYERALDPRNGRVREQSVGIKSGITTRPWVSLSADSLRRIGYVVTGAGGWVTYYAPDLDVLLSSAFLEDHCLRVARSTDDSRVGIAFEPTRERSRMAEIRGTVWLDRKSAELRKMDFRYTNIPREQEREDAGGEMEFVRMKNGAWAISRWQIRMPVLEMREASEASGVPGIPTRPETRLSEIKLAGGELSMIARGADTLFALPPLTLSGVVVDSASGGPLPGARVELKGTSLATVADATGRFAIAGVLPGAYTLEVSTPPMDSVGLVQQSSVTFADATLPLMIRVRKRAVFHGYVMADSTLRPIEGAEVILPGLSLATRTKANGSFRILDVPPGAHIVLVRQIGFASANVQLPFAPIAVMSQSFVLRPTGTITSVGTSEPPKPGRVREFEERRARGIGNFITREQLDARANSRTSDVLAGVPGLRVVRSQSGSQAWAASNRGKMSIDNERQPDGGSAARGARPACYSDVYMDGIMLYGGGAGELYDLNTLTPAMLEAIEWFVSGGHIPPEYNRSGSACGVLLLWTRRGG
jgi:hypothetical protein